LHHKIGTAAIQSRILQRRQFPNRARRNPRHGNSARAHDPRSIEENHLIDNSRFEGRAIQLRAGFQENVQDFTAAKFAHRFAESHTTPVSTH